jgi:predicted  nucleic acid-binding Zn-ribbon protein
MAESFDAKLERALTSLEVKLDAIAKRVETHQLATERIEKALSEIRVTVNGLKQQKT